MSPVDGLTYLVQTTLGNSLVSAGSKTLVNMMGDTYLPVSVEHLKEGQMILYLKEHIDKTMEEVDPVLLRSARYTSARDAMHATDGNGRRTTRLRRDLVEAFGKEAGVSNLESRVYGTTTDFDEAEYGRMIDKVNETLKEAGVEREYHRTTIKAWLDGSTLAPADWSVFDALAKKSQSFADYGNQDLNLKDHYSLYVTVRKGVMHYLASKGKEPPKKHSAEKERKRKGGSLKLEIDLVVEEFMEDISAQYATALVTNIKTFTPRDMQRRPPSPDIRLHDGVVTKVAEGEDIRVVDYTDITTERNLLNGVLIFAFEAYLQKNPEKVWIDAARKSSPSLDVDSYSLALITEFLARDSFKFTKPTDRHQMQLIQQSIGSAVNLRQVTSRVTEHMQDGTIDSLLGFEEGTVMRAHRTYGRIVTMLPGEVYELDLIPAFINEGVMNQRVAERRMQEIEARLLDEYSLEIPRVKTLLSLAYGAINRTKVTNRAGFYRDAETMDKVAQRVAEREELQKILTREEAKKRLEANGFGALMRLIPETIWAADSWRKS